jgi:KTSC domain
MERQNLHSSAIRSAGYDPITKTMELEFQSGGTHEFADVAPEHFSGLVQSDSAGRYFHQHIKPRYRGRKTS